MPIERWVPLGIVQPPSRLEETLLPPVRYVADDTGWVHRICHHGAHRRSPHLAKQAVLRPARLGDHVRLILYVHVCVACARRRNKTVRFIC